MAVSKTNEKKATASTKAKEKKATESKVTEVDVEKEALKEQVAKMQAQMEAMMAMMGNNMNHNVSEEKSNRMIKFVKLTNATVVLKGTNFWDIEGERYAYREFPEKEARVIALKMPEFLRSGIVYIDDAEFVKDNDLDIVYGSLLSDKDLKTLLDKNATDVIQTYQNVNEKQKEIIIETILADKKAGKNIDNNILVTLGSLSGKDLINSDDE